MPFEIVRNNIVNMKVDAIVNTANPRPIVGSGTDQAIHTAAGPRLLEARKQIGPIEVGHCAVTPAFDLDARYVIHTVGPRWQGGGLGEADQLRSCYRTALRLALEYGCQSIAFPLISTGHYGFPNDKALDIALGVFQDFLEHQDMMIYLVVFHRKAFRLSEQRMDSVASYIDEHYVREVCRTMYRPSRFQRQRLAEDVRWESVSMAAPAPLSLNELLSQTDAGFTETLLKLIDQTGQKDSVIYKKANITKQHFSKIKNNVQYKPTKATAVAFAIALKLDLEETKDLIGRAGYALTNSSKFDIIIRYFIEQGNYNLFDINTTLFEFDQPLLGG